MGATTHDGTGGTESLGARIYNRLSSVPTWILWILVAIWTLPSFSLVVNSFRARSDQRNGGFWEVGGDPGQLTLENYDRVLSRSGVDSLYDSLISSFAIAIPATIIPIAFATFAAYGFAWIDFRGRQWLFIGTVSAPNPIYVKNATKNVPEFQTWSYEYYRTYPYRAPQWWLDE